MMQVIPTDHPSFPQHVPALDGIRGLAALWVTLSHCLIWGGGDTTLLPDPKIAVDIFMLISGYLMMHGYQNSIYSSDRSRPGFARKFWMRRFFRIAPLYYLALTIALILQPCRKAGIIALQSVNPQRWINTDYFLSPVSQSPGMYEQLENFLIHITFLFGLHPTYARSSGLPDWSIGLEMQFYAIFPLLILLARSLGIITTLALAIVIGNLLVQAIPLIYGVGACFPEPSFLPLKISLFALGIALAAGSHIFNRNASQGLLILICGWTFSLQYSILISIVSAVLILSTGWMKAAGPFPAALSRIIATVLGSRIARFLADTSYGVYLFHGFFISIFGGWFYVQPWAIAFGHRLPILTVVVVCAAYSIAWLLHQWIELPGIALGRKVAVRLGIEPVIKERP